jgi:sucrose phosphorylase
MIENSIYKFLEFIYGGAGVELAPRLMGLLENFMKEGPQTAFSETGSPAISNKDALLISYGDMLSGPGDGAEKSGESGLGRLRRFLADRNRGDFTYLHLLPFHPYSSDDGFSVIDYRQVDSHLGGWEGIESLASRFKMAFDFVINHGSVKAEWFKKFLEGDGQFKGWYLIRPSGYDYSAVVRPRTHPLLSAFTRADGAEAYVWTTFSADQADYDFSNPEVLLEFVDIFLSYCRRGCRMVRLDAIAYLWKEDGTPCLHHPKTHAMVRLLRAIVDYLGLPVLLLTETNVPHKENLSYFGSGFELEPEGHCPEGREAHLVYNFALPPLCLHAAISGNAGPLRLWAAGLPALPESCCFLNFLASHDGVGLSPARGLVDDTAFAETLEIAKGRGALVSMKSTQAGPVPYELNCSWADMVAPQDMGPVELQARAFLATYAVALALPGLPAVYFHSWTGSRAWKEGPGLLGYNRAINREKPAIDNLEQEIRQGGFRSLVMQGFHRLFELRQAEEAFSPASPCEVLRSEGGIFAVLRESLQGRKVAAIQNFSGQEAALELPLLGELTIEGHGVKWLAFDKAGIKKELIL